MKTMCYVGPEFNRALREATQPKGHLAVAAGFPNASLLSATLHTPWRKTEQRCERLRRLAELIGYQGQPWIEHTPQTWADYVANMPRDPRAFGEPARPKTARRRAKTLSR